MRLTIARIRAATAALGALAIAATIAGCGSSGPAAHIPPTTTVWSHITVHGKVTRSETFLSLWPACACGHTTMLDVFSLKTGERLGDLMKIPNTGWAPAARLTATSNGQALLTFSTGPTCGGPALSSGPCVPKPRSCRSWIEQANPLTGVARRLLVLPDSTVVRNSVPSPDGKMLAMTSAGCTTSIMDDHVVVRDLATRRQWAIGADAVRCHDLGPISWSPDGRRLVFAYAPSRLPAGTKPSTSQFCDAPGRSRLVVVSSLHPSSATSWRPISAQRSCHFVAAAFDTGGIAAVEVCGAPASSVKGLAYAVQLNSHWQVVKRLALQRGWEEGLVAAIPHTGSVLITESQPANEGYPERDWVWEFDGSHLRLIAKYPANDAAQVIAVPW